MTATYTSTSCNSENVVACSQLVARGCCMHVFLVKIISDAQGSFVSVQNLYFLNYAKVNVKRFAFCLKIIFQSKTGLCLQIGEVSTTGGHFNIT